ncbi:hypothetical protein CYLTODRAFT_401620 [Cylindrobasidium torrendii FP15055 ss-10]|uniref:LIM zinc-binding domain-containing protein n=1 Tax=Cylindrobasidium torrendii FP15055 ss-10 TaxID=1314674 RepID=A0A0D7B4Y3_9AGAR|nr:hypothetical protein CYLTODRAFT_401620 [Cylindrobasidium torrendii FP15055 ss-10]
MARPLPGNPPMSGNTASLTMRFASMNVDDQHSGGSWSQPPLPTPPQPSPTRSGRPRPMSMNSSPSAPGSYFPPNAPPTMHSSRPRPMSVSGMPPSQPPQQSQDYNAYGSNDHPQMRTGIHPRAQQLTQSHAQSQIVHREWLQQQEAQRRQVRPSQLPPAMRGVISSGFQRGPISPASPTPPSRERSPTRPVSGFTPTSSFPNGIPNGGIPRPGSAFSHPPPPRPPSMAGPSYSQPPNAAPPRPPSMATTSYSQPNPSAPHTSSQYPQPSAPIHSYSHQQTFQHAPPSHPSSPTKHGGHLPQIPLEYPPPPVHPDSPTRRSRDLSPVRSNPSLKEKSFSRPASPHRQSSFPKPAPVPPLPQRREASPVSSRAISPQREASPVRTLPRPGGAPTPNTATQRLPMSSFPPGTSASAIAQAQKALGSRAFPQPPTHVPTVTQPRAFPSGQPATQQPPAQPSPVLSRQSSPTRDQQRMPPRVQPPMIREPSPTRPIRLPNLDDPAPEPVSPNLRGRSPRPTGPVRSPQVPQINIPQEPTSAPSARSRQASPQRAPQIILPGDNDVPQINVSNIPQINVGSIPQINVGNIPQISFDVPEINIGGVPEITVGDRSQPRPGGGGPRAPRVPQQQQQQQHPQHQQQPQQYQNQHQPPSPGGGTAKFDSRPTPSYSSTRANGMTCAGCNLVIIGRMVSSGTAERSSRWHPECFACTVCSEHLEHVSSYERDGRMYCHLDYHEAFAPACSHCRTPIIDEEYISLDEPGLGGQRNYHAQHFFCAECGDPFLEPGQELSSAEYIIHKGYPYCEACHVRLRMPLCRRNGCGKRIREWEGAIEAMGGKWCEGCFRCNGCQQSLGETFYERGGSAWCQDCFSIILRNEL